MRQLMNNPIPGRTVELIDLLDRIIEPATVREKDDLDPFDLGHKAGQRYLVDTLKTAITKDTQ